jgi:hypothetical protein
LITTICLAGSNDSQKTVSEIVVKASQISSALT